jgi:subtilisin family serine protease
MLLRPILLGALAAVSVVAFAAGAVSAATPPLATLGVPAAEVAPVASAAVHRALERRDAVNVIVALRGDVPSARQLSARRDAVDALQGRVLRGLEPSEFELSRRWTATPGFAGTVTREGLEELLVSPEVARIDIDRRMRASLAESAALIRAPETHAEGVTGKGAIVAVVDTGIDTDNPDLADDLAGEACFLHKPSGSGACPNGAARQTGRGSAEDDEGHGTSVSAIITSRGTASPRGVAPDAKIVAVKVLGADGTGPTSDIVAGLDWILSSRRDVKVVNMSLGGDEVFAGGCDDADAITRAYASVLNALRARGVTVFAASGNGGSASGMGDPACVRSVVSVGAVYDANLGEQSHGDTCEDAATAADQVTCFTDADGTLDLVAPGAAITAAKRGGGVDAFVGTSAAAPHASGVAALMLEAKPALVPDQIEATLKSTGVPVNDSRRGVVFPRVDALAAVRAVPGLPDVAPPGSLPAGTSSFADGGGETLIAPEVRNVSVTSSGDGLLTFAIAMPNRADGLIAGEFVEIYVDVDKSAATGQGGADYLFTAAANAPAVLARWVGSWQPVRPLETVGFSSGAMRLTFVAAEIGVRSDFVFWATSGWSRGVVDRAPDGGSWPYPAFPLTVAKAGTGSGTVTGGAINCGAVCSAGLARDTSVTLTAVPAPGSVFIEWGGVCAGAARCTTTLSEARHVIARFEALRRITVTKAGTGIGSVSAGSLIACGATCVATAVHGTVVTLTATPQKGSRLTRWGGSCAGKAPCQLTVDGDETVTAEFADVAKPVVTVFRSRVRAGRLVRLRYRVRDNVSASANTEAVVQVRGRTVTRFFNALSAPTGTVVTGLWVAPSTPTKGVRFCVRATDQAGNRSARRCAPIRISP